MTRVCLKLLKYKICARTNRYRQNIPGFSSLLKNYKKNREKKMPFSLNQLDNIFPPETTPEVDNRSDK